MTTPPRPDQEIAPPAAVIAAGGNAGVFRGRLVIIFGTSTTGGTGLFVYSPTPGAGNLVASIVSATGTDAYGNAVFGPGFATYSGNTSADVYTLLTSGNIDFGVVSDGGTGSGGSLNLLTSPVLQLQFASSQPFALTDDIVFAAGQFVWEGTDSQGQTKEVWHTLTPQNGWSQGTPVAQCRKIALPNEVEIVGDVTGGTIADGTLLFTLPSGYRPAASQDIPVITIGNSASPTATPRLHVNTDGTTLVEGLPTATNELRFNETIHLDL